MNDDLRAEVAALEETLRRAPDPDGLFRALESFLEASESEFGDERDRLVARRAALLFLDACRDRRADAVTEARTARMRQRLDLAVLDVGSRPESPRRFVRLGEAPDGRRLRRRRRGPARAAPAPVVETVAAAPGDPLSRALDAEADALFDELRERFEFGWNTRTSVRRRMKDVLLAGLRRAADAARRAP
jgi:hypothetical protein